MKATDRYLRYLSDERKASRMYRALAELADGDRRAALLELADIEDRHAAHWVSLLQHAGADVPAEDPSLDPDDEAMLRRARQFSLDTVLPELEQAERDAQGIYDDEPDAAPGMADDEREHERVLRRLSSAGSAAPQKARSPDEVRSAMNRSEPWHRTDKSGSLRAAVFGASDGLVSNTALVMGFAGSGAAGGVDSRTVLFAGIAGLLAGAFSMGAGEYVSVASQRDVFHREIALEKSELESKPLEEQRELELIYRAKGLDAVTARTTAETIMSNPDVALDTLVREELGLDPGDLGSPLRVALFSFVAFAVGAVVPVLPYLFATDTTALVLAVVFASVALLAVGGTVGRLSGLGVVRSALRQFLVGAGAAAFTYALGLAVGSSLG
jgi:VIT1/CCC1 family predicted Fe2+/Mn2+ transporter